MTTLIIIGIVAGWAACGAGAYLMLRGDLRRSGRWTIGSRRATIGLCLFGPASLIGIFLSGLDDDTPAKW